MKQLLHLAVVGCSLPLIEAGGFKWNSNKDHDLGADVPAQETGDLNMHLQPDTAQPEPTSPPDLRGSKMELARRASSVPGSVCGYMSHDLDSTLACAVDNTCLFTTFGNSWMAGCCPTTSMDCPIATTCIDSSVGETLFSIGISTYWCSSSSYPVCVTLSYQDVPGYTIYNCGGPLVITTQTIDHQLDASSISLSTSKSTSSSASTNGGSSTTSVAGSSTTSSAPATTSSSTGSSKSSVPIGAIVGGAVGGVALIVILILGIFLIVRRSGSRKNTSQPPNNSMAPSAPPHGYTGGATPSGTYLPPQPAMQQQQHQHQHQQHQHQQYPTNGAPPPPFVDNRASIQKAPYDVNTQSVYAPTLSTPGSPPPPPHTPSPSFGTLPAYPSTTSSSPPPQQQHQQHQQHQHHGQGQSQGFSPTDPTFRVSQQNTGTAQTIHGQHQHQPQQQPQPQPNHASYHEMSAMRPDGELRELA